MAYIDGYVQNRHGNTTLWLYKGDYIKLKNLSLGYTLPKNWVSKIAMQNARVYVSAENLLTITGFEGKTRNLLPVWAILRLGQLQ